MTLSLTRETATEEVSLTITPHAREAFLPTPYEAGCGGCEDGGAERTDGELDLLQRARSGDKGALDRLLSAARPRALAVALKVLRNPDDAEDAVQEALLKIWRYLPRFEGRSSFSTWVHRIVMNACLDLLRRQASRPAQAHDEEPGQRPEPEEATTHETPERAFGRAEVGRIVHGALAALSPAHRHALTLRELEEHSYEEIADAAAIPIGTVMSRLHHARKKLTEALTASVAADAPVLCAA
jgi:RNA polymerase sigma-70 factor (ECF subfamily)